MPQLGVRCATCPAWDSEDGERGECHDGQATFLVPAPANPLDPGAKRGLSVKATYIPRLAGDWCTHHPDFDWHVGVVPN